MSGWHDAPADRARPPPPVVLTHLVAIAVLAVYLAALAGWGGLLHRLCGGGERVPWTYRAALGVAVVALLGGPLNLLQLAYAPVLDGVVVVGLLLAVGAAVAALRARRAGGPSPGWRARGADLAPRLVIGGAALFLVATVLPTGIFNHHDDMQKYMVPPVRMLATGTLGGNPFGTIGFYSLGFQSFFHAFGAAHFPLVYLNAFDAVLCFLLTGLLLDDLGRRGGVAPVVRTLGALVLVAINPQYVNISSVFSGSLAVAGLAWSAILLFERIRSAPPGAVALAALPVGLFAVLLMGLKLTHLPFGALIVAVLLALLPHLAGGWRRAAPAVGGFLLGALLLAAPWAAVYEHTPLGPLVAYAGTFAARTLQDVAEPPPPTLEDEGARTGRLGGGAPAEDEPSIADVFSTRGVYFGQTALAYGVVVLAVAVVAVLAGVGLIRRRRDGDPGLRAQLAVTLATGVAVVAYYLATPYVFSVTQAIRYVAPLLIPTAVLAVLGAGRVTAGGGGAPWTTRGVAAVACMGLVVGLFVRATVDRVAEALLARTVVSFPLNSFNPQYNRYAFGPEMREAVGSAQGRIPPGAPTLAWIGAPFRLDFRRNPVYTIPDPDFTERWLGMPISDDPGELRAFLRARGIRYVIWAYNAPGMRSDASLRQDIASGLYASRGVITLKFKQVLAALAREGAVVFDDGHMVAFALEPPAAAPEAAPPPPAAP